MDSSKMGMRKESLTRRNVMQTRNMPLSLINLLWVRFAGMHKATHSKCVKVVHDRRLTKRSSVTAPLHAHLFGVDRRMVRLSATLADCTQRYETYLDQQI